ncbi:MAG: hypothetical protein HBSIN02_08010 [Bacteroidia bacterium]|nr:MAG: hypothetical protein HBSIN02_08010 [Bacteroidia bacterium]
MRRIAVKHVDAFTAAPYAGNPAGVVTDARGLSDARMQLIARELAMSETAFVLPATLKAADLQMRWFTPTVEVPLCGHATIAAFHALAEDGMYGMRQYGRHPFAVQTKSGILQVLVEKKSAGISVEFHLPVPVFSSVRKASPRLLKSLGLGRKDLETRLPMVRGNDIVFVPVRRRTALWKLEPDMNTLTAVSKSMGIIGACAVTLQTIEPSSAFHSRFFAPAAGVPEDPVTGSANGPLGAYCFRYAMRSAGIPLPSLRLEDGRLEFIGEQGDSMSRRGRVKVRLEIKKGRVKDVSIAGEAVTLFRTSLSV